MEPLIMNQSELILYNIIMKKMEKTLKEEMTKQWQLQPTMVFHANCRIKDEQRREDRNFLITFKGEPFIVNADRFTFSFTDIASIGSIINVDELKSINIDGRIFEENN